MADYETLISLRPIEREDLTFLRDLASDATVRSQVVGWGWPTSLVNQERWFEAQLRDTDTQRFIVCDAVGEPLGVAGLWGIDWHNSTAEVGLKLGPGQQVRGKGYGFRALTAVTEFGFWDVGLHRLWAGMLSTNEASYRLFTVKAGWREEGRLREHVWRDGAYCDLIQVGLLRSEYVSPTGRTIVAPARNIPADDAGEC